jgi:hypothetical protein
MEGEKMKVRPIYAPEDFRKMIREQFEKYESGGIHIGLVGDRYAIVADERGIRLNKRINYSEYPYVWFKSFSELESYLKKAHELELQVEAQRKADKERKERMTKQNVNRFLGN